MKVALIKPYNLTDHIQPSLGLGYLATAIRKDHEVAIIDCIKEKLKLNNFARRIKAEQPDVVGMQCHTFDLNFIKEAFAICRSANRKIVNIIGGAHPTADPQGTMEAFRGLVDFIFVGEAEIGLPMLLNRLKDGGPFADIPGLVWENNGSIVLNQRQFVRDLDSLGLPAWDLIKPETYPEAQHGAFYKKFPIATIILTRGCPYRCTFCSAGLMAGRKLRKRSIDHVLSEIELLYFEHGIREIHIVDDNFTLDRNYAKRFLISLKKLNLDISLATPNGVRIDAMDDELLALFKENGLYLISLGIESGTDRVLSLMKKNITVAQIREATNKIKKAGIEMAGFFIIGFPGETKQEIEQTIRFSLELGLLRSNYFTFLPFPGTESYEKLRAEGKLGRVKWEKFYFMSAPYSPDGIPNEQLRKLQRKAFLKFYLRPHILLKNIAGVRSLKHLKYLSRRFIYWMLMS